MDDHYRKLETREDGSCFYSALYRAARDHTPSLLKKLYKIFEVKYEEPSEKPEIETRFIYGVSKSVAEAIRNCVYYNIKKKNIEGTRTNTSIDSEQARKVQMSETMTPFQAIQKDPLIFTNFLEESSNTIQNLLVDFNTFKKKYKDEELFYKAIADVLDERKPGQFIFASQIDIEVIREILDVNAVGLFIVSNIEDIKEESRPTLWLFKGKTVKYTDKQVVISGNHYEYFKKDTSKEEEEDDGDYEELEDEDEDEDEYEDDESTKVPRGPTGLGPTAFAAQGPTAFAAQGPTGLGSTAFAAQGPTAFAAQGPTGLAPTIAMSVANDAEQSDEEQSDEEQSDEEQSDEEQSDEEEAKNKK
jgi:hypothetical protein